MKSRKIMGNVLLLFTALIWGCAFAFQRMGMDSIEPVTFTAARMALAAVAVGLVAFIFRLKEKKDPPKKTEEERKKYNRYTIIGGICCGTFLCVATILQQIGLVYTTAGKAGFITAMYMLLVPVISFVFLKKKYAWLVWVAVFLGVVGMYFLCITEQFTLSPGDGLVCICALLFTFHILCCDYFAKRGDPLRISAIQFAAATVISAVIAFIAEKPSTDKIISAIIPILYCGIVSGGIGYTLQIVAQKITDPTVASLLLSLEAVFAVFAGAFLLHERMSIRELIGCVIMLAAVILVQIPLPKKNKTAEGEAPDAPHTDNENNRK